MFKFTFCSVEGLLVPQGHAIALTPVGQAWGVPTEQLDQSRAEFGARRPRVYSQNPEVGSSAVVLNYRNQPKERGS